MASGRINRNVPTKRWVVGGSTLAMSVIAIDERPTTPANTPFEPGIRLEGYSFRLILPEAIAIGIRFSHASRTSSHSWRIAQ